MQTIDSEKQTSKSKELWTIRLLLLTVLLTAFNLIVLTLDGTIRIPHRYQMLLPPFSIPIAFVSSIAGFVVGFYERKKNKRQALFGIIGNLVILILYISSLITVISLIK